MVTTTNLTSLNAIIKPVEHRSTMPLIKLRDDYDSKESLQQTSSLNNIELKPVRNRFGIISAIKLTNQGKENVCVYSKTWRENESTRSIETDVCLSPQKSYNMAVPTMEDQRVVNPVRIFLKLNEEKKEEKFF